MKTKNRQIEVLQRKCVNDVYNIIYNKCNKELDLTIFPFYLVYCAEDNTIAVRISKVKISEFNELIFIGTDSYNNKYELDEGSDIINYMGFDLYNSVMQQVELNKKLY